MTLTQTATGRRRRLLVPTTAESVPQPPPPERPAPQDPPIYRALVSHWADRGKTLPGRHDPEWARLTASPVRTGQFSGFRDRPGAAR
ncbi:hypothetical protein ACFVZT_36255 [Streptomyces sp. NPDC058321]|uniref:hypothetical protein n=1 Tax=Streptomyces sp. NPDC058321 TaxID=3346445 RepID=UPI0036EFCF90